ncbi:uncharacterized protein LOC135157193 [Lytechinus pictus]|uniref:uncharacterized protein LOC135157193 n=1 Tax=Lytechinus pictus TaxID=7653 RepID=UPI0030BA1AB2
MDWVHWHYIGLGALLFVEFVTGLSSGRSESFLNYASYDGCYNATCMGHSKMNFTFNVSRNSSYTPDNCTGLCYDAGYPWAGILRETECLCLCLNCNKSGRVPKEYCGIPCTGDIQQFCGGRYWTSIYRINFGFNRSADCDTQSFHFNWKLIGIATGGATIIVVLIIVIVMIVVHGCTSSGETSRRVRRKTRRPYSDYIFMIRRRPSSERKPKQSRVPKRNLAAATAADVPPLPRRNPVKINTRPPLAVPGSVVYHEICENGEEETTTL